ncbi:MAG: hemolysin family protein [Caldisericaceae bacterium]
MGVAITIIILVALVLFSALFTVIESAFFNSSFSRLELKTKSNPNAEKIVNFKKNPDRFISTVVLGNNFVNILFSALLTYFALKISSTYSINSSISITLSTIIATVIIVIFGETIPKNIGAFNAEGIALALYPFFRVFWYILSPFVFIVSGLSNGVLKLLKVDTSSKKVFDSQEEVISMIQIGKEEGVIEKAEEKMIYSIFEFGDTIVADVMTPRVDIVALPVTATKEDVLKTITETGHSRIPVYEEQIDDIKGILYIKDFIKLMADGTNFDLSSIVRNAYFVPETKRVDELFTEMQKGKIQIAMVFDEYGGISGLITIEDILEEIVGEISDEHEKEEKDIEKIGENAFLVSGAVTIDEFNEAFHSDFSDEEASTIGGIILSKLGRLPNPGEEINIDKFKFIISKIKDRRIIKIKVIIMK